MQASALALLLLLGLARARALALAFHAPGPRLRCPRGVGPAVCARAQGGLLRLRASDDQPGAPEVDEIMAGIAQLQAGMASIQAGLGRKMNSGAETVKTGFASSLNGMQEIIGADVYIEKVEQAQAAVLQNIGIAEKFVPEVEGPPFSLANAVWLAGCAFDAYNDPSGGIVKQYQDGTRVSYSSSRGLAQLHSGVLLVRIKSAELTPGEGLLGSQNARCDPYVMIEVNGAVRETKTIKNTLSPTFDEQLVMYTGAVDEDSLRLMLYDKDLLLGKEDLQGLTPDPLVGVAEIPLAQLVAEQGWVSLEVQLEQPDEPTTRADIENANNPYWLKVPRGAMIQAWPNLMAGSAVGGTLKIDAQFVPLDAGAPAGSGGGEGEHAAPGVGTSELVAAEWALLAESSRDVEVDPAVFRRQNLERLAFLDNDETDTQLTVWRDALQKRLVISFRGTEQTRWKDLITDALVAQVHAPLGAVLLAAGQLPLRDPLSPQRAALGTFDTGCDAHALVPLPPLGNSTPKPEYRNLKPDTETLNPQPHTPIPQP